MIMCRIQRKRSALMYVETDEGVRKASIELWALDVVL